MTAITTCQSNERSVLFSAVVMRDMSEREGSGAPRHLPCAIAGSPLGVCWNEGREKRLAKKPVENEG